MTALAGELGLSVSRVSHLIAEAAAEAGGGAEATSAWALA
jgi:hypothetical protein